MPKIKKPISLPLATIEAIVAAAKPRASLTPDTMEALRNWLSAALDQAISRARAKPICKDDVDRLDAAYRLFLDVIDELQDRDNPPPRIPVARGSTDWEHWLVGYQEWGFKRGRPECRDWRLISALLGLYETLSGKRASGTQEDGPTMRYLDVALSELSGHVPPDVRSNFAWLKAETLKQQLKHLREFNIPFETRKLAKIMNRGG